MMSIELIAGIIIFGFTLTITILPHIKRQSRSFNRWIRKKEKDITNSVKWWIIALLGIVSFYLIINCFFCDVPGQNPYSNDASFFENIFLYFQRIIPWFIIGCIISGYVIKLMSDGKLRLPKSMLGAGIFASIIPICSCAAVPMAHGMLLGRKVPFRTIIAFLIIVPILSPVMISLALSQIGWEYLLTLIVSVFFMAMVSGIIIERLVGVQKAGKTKGSCYSCKGCKTSHVGKKRNSAMLASWDQLMHLLKYIMVGIIIGAAIAAFIEPGDLVALFGSNGTGFLQSIPGLVLIVLIAIPLFICSGEDILILTPLIAMGLPLGHAIAFAIAGNAICITSIPVLTATFGKKVTFLLISTFFLGAILLGLGINAIFYTI